MAVDSLQATANPLSVVHSTSFHILLEIECRLTKSELDIRTFDLSTVSNMLVLLFLSKVLYK